MEAVYTQHLIGTVERRRNRWIVVRRLAGVVVELLKQSARGDDLERLLGGAGSTTLLPAREVDRALNLSYRL